ncbi:MAG: hypothetical protein A2Y33_05990 [Spirochaetes bacterium GWF1_51_8]|nr:MAG: hypothetical protein A2Y33_05990 [Spirochaetes bacterium GWF1_51_8]
MPFIETTSPVQYSETVKASKVFLTYFFSDGCPPCKDLSPRIASLMDELADIPWTKIDPSVFPEVAAQNLVFTVPIAAVYAYGREVFKSSRFVDIAQLRKTLEAYRDAE